ncbi:MAG: gamma-glutamyl-gamma-aminobutyrate hydrolase family protein [Oscillospiraceae bacterium]|nr:gamma-glutamyl-gamma-aminobutyrate hydrolase family protein [Oscillospiraceae bacterium]
MKKCVSKTLSLLIAAALLAGMLCTGAFASSEEPSTELVQVGVSWVGDFEDGVPDEDTQAYIDAVELAGAEAVYLPQATDADSAAAALETVDCIILTGGEDLDPALYGEEPYELLETVNQVRDVSDYWYCTVALEMDMPILATCRGLQLLNVVCGGTLYQDFPSQYETDVEVIHRDPAGEDFAYHNITVEDETSLVAQAMGGAGEYEVNSWHHQAIKDLGEGLVVTAVADDGIIEAVELPEASFVLAVQFHPEWMIQEVCEDYVTFFTMLIEAASQTASGTEESDYQAYLMAFVDSCEDIRTSGAAEEFYALIEAGDYVSFPVEMLFDATWFGEAAMTYEEFVAADGTYEIGEHASNGAMLDGTGE